MAPLAFLFPGPLRSLSGPLSRPHDPLSPPPGQRASDADRDTAVDILSAAAADGRLTLAELEERVETALSARTIPELAALIADLPGPWTPSPPPMPAPAAVPEPGTCTASPAPPASPAWASRAPERWALLQSLAVAHGALPGQFGPAARGRPECIATTRQTPPDQPVDNLLTGHLQTCSAPYLPAGERARMSVSRGTMP